MKTEKFKSIVLLLSGLFIIVCSIFLFIKSYAFYQDEYGTDISFNSDYVVSLLCGLVLTIYSIIRLKRNDQSGDTYLISGLVISALVGFYPLGVFFKAMNKQKLFSDYQSYLFIGIFGVLLLMYYGTSCLKFLKEKE